MPLRAWWSRNRTFLVVVIALLLVLLLTAFVFTVSGTGDSGVDMGGIETAP